ncbi:50S ribosomal protein L19 [Candidatus Microgenomates bacterium]|nr:50S ribosomal protein L19 [Candidatus Microgenomates bacterium]
MALLAEFNKTKFNVGDEIEVHLKIVEKKKERIQIFKGLVIAIRGREENKNFIVRKIASLGIGVERIFPLNSPWIKKIVVKRKGKVRRAKLYYLRERTGKAAVRVKEKK